jgi:hypothetical protein
VNYDEKLFHRALQKNSKVEFSLTALKISNFRLVVQPHNVTLLIELSMPVANNFPYFLPLNRDKTSAKNRRCKVIYSYKESKDDELTLAVGDLIEVYEEVRPLITSLLPNIISL